MACHYRRALVLLIAAMLLFAPAAHASPPSSGESNFLLDVARNIFNSRELMRILGQKEFTVAAFAVVNGIVFTETGLLIGFFLPGDSLLVTTGLIAREADWPLLLLLITVCLSAIIGDSVGYAIGWRAGPKIFCREKSFFFKKDHLLHAQHFYEKHGGKTIILARFIPILRTFAPVVAGVGKMEYRRFLLYNNIGGVGGVVSKILFGYILPTLIEPAIRPIFGPEFEVQDHVEKVIVLVVLASISPGIYFWLRTKFRGKKPEPEALEPACKP
jgi:membrane-associated protein